MNNELICQVSGFRVPVSEGLVRRWDGVWVRRKDLDLRHPQDFVRARAERLRGSVSPEPGDVFIEDAYPNGVTVDDL